MIAEVAQTREAIEYNLKDVDQWAIKKGQSPDAIRCLRRIPARLNLLDADMAVLSADPVRFDRDVAGKGYALVSRAKDMEASGRREDACVWALLRRFHAERHQIGAPGEACPVRARYDALIEVIAAREGPPGSGQRWNCGRHRSMTVLRARASVAPENLSQIEIDRIAKELSADKRKSLRKAVHLFESLRRLTNKIPELREFLPVTPLDPPTGSSPARRIDWETLPKTFRLSFEKAADAALAGHKDLADQMLQRIEAGEDPELIMAESDALGASMVARVGKPTAARDGYRHAVAWLVRSWINEGGDIRSGERGELVAAQSLAPTPELLLVPAAGFNDAGVVSDAGEGRAASAAASALRASCESIASTCPASTIAVPIPSFTSVKPRSSAARTCAAARRASTRELVPLGKRQKRRMQISWSMQIGVRILTHQTRPRR